MENQNRNKLSIYDKPLSKGKSEINFTSFALLFSEIVLYCSNSVHSVSDLQNKLSSIGKHVGARLLEVLVLRERGFKRDAKLLNVLLFIKSNVWKNLFDKEADKLEHANDEDNIYYIIEKECILNKYISSPNDKGTLNCASFVAGIIEAILEGSDFPVKVTAHFHKGTTYMLKFNESVITRDKELEQQR